MISRLFIFDLYRKDADASLENLAAISGGKTYFVDDGNYEFIHLGFFTISLFITRYLLLGTGLQDIVDVFTESNTYQPAVPSHEEEIVVCIQTIFTVSILCHLFS